MLDVREIGSRMEIASTEPEHASYTTKQSYRQRDRTTDDRGRPLGPHRTFASAVEGQARRVARCSTAADDEGGGIWRRLHTSAP